MAREVNERECRAVGVSPAKVREIAELIDKAAKLARKCGITIFGGAHSGDLRKHRGSENRAFILARLDGPFDGGDGGCCEDSDGYMRGE